MRRRICARLVGMAISSVLAAAAWGNTADQWVQPISGQWWTASDWSSGVPTASSDVTIGASGAAYNVDTGSTGAAQAASVTVTSSSAYLLVGSNTSLRASIVDVEAGTFAVGGALYDARVEGPGTIQVVNLGSVSNVTVASSLTFYGATTAYGNLTLDNGTIHVGGTSSSGVATIALSNLTGSGQLVFDGATASEATSQSMGVSTLQGDAVVIGANVSLTNGRGEIALSGNVTNAGNISILPNHYLFVNGSFQNNGSLDINQGTVIFNSATATTALGNFTRNGGKMIFNSQLTVPGGTLDLDSAFQGNVTLAGSTDATQITGSANRTLTIAAPAFSSSNSLAFTFLASSVTLSTDTYFYSWNGRGAATFAGDAVLDHHSFAIQQGTTVNVGGTLGGNGDVVFLDGYAGAYGEPTSVLSGAGNGAFTIGAGVTVRTDPSNSLLSAQIGSLGGFDNKGVISADGGALRLLGNGWTNEGTINLTAGSLSLGGSTTTAGLGTINRTGGLLYLQGLQLDNSNATFTLDAAHGNWVVLSGAIHGGTILGSGGSLTTSTNANLTLDGVTLAGDFSTSLIGATVLNGLTLSSADVKITWLGFEGDETLGGNGTLLFNAPNGGTASISPSNGTLTIAPGVAIRTDTSNGLVGSYNVSYPLINSGLISSEKPNDTLTILCSSATNLGTLSATSGGVLAVSNLINQGLVTADGSTLKFSGSFSNSGNVTTSNSTVVFNSTFANTGNMALSNTTAVLAFYDPNQQIGNVSHTGQTIFAAAVHDLPAAVDLGATPFGPADIGNGSSFSNVTVTDSAGACSLLAGNSTTFNATLACTLVMQTGSTITGNIGMQNGCISMAPAPLSTNSISTNSLSGTGVVKFDGSGGTSTITGTGTSDIVIDPGITIRTGTGSGSIGASGITTVNNGLISAETPGNSITLSGNFTNNGTLSASNGGWLVLSLNFTNNGTVRLDQGTVVIGELAPLGGTLQRNGGTVLFGGTISGSPSSLDLTDPFWGQLDLAGAMLANLTLNSSGGVPTVRAVPGGTPKPTIFSSVTLGTDLMIGAGADLTLSSPGSLIMGGHLVEMEGKAGALATLWIGPSAYWSGGVIEFDGTGSANQLGNSFSGTIPSSVTVRSGDSGGTINMPNITIYGQVLSRSSGGGISLQGSVSTVSGSLLQAANGGSLDVSGSVTDNGVIDIDATSVMTVAGRFNGGGKGQLQGAGVLNAKSIMGYINTPLTINITGNTVNVVSRLLLAGATDNWTGKVNLGSADMIVRSTTGDASTLLNQLRQGFDGGAWNGSGGITASPAGTRGVESGIALLTGADYLAATGSATFEGQTYVSTDLLLMHAIPGDANLDGQVDANDLNLVLSNFGKATSSWTAGNFVYDPTIDLSDLSAVLNHMGIGTAGPGGTTAGSGVPEPASLAVMTLGLVGLLKRRRF